MVIHYFTLQALCNELSEILAGMQIREVFTQQKNELVMLLSPAGSGESKALCVSVQPNFNYFFLRNDFKRAKRNSSDLFPSIIDQTLSGLSLAGLDRTIEAKFSGNEK